RRWQGANLANGNYEAIAIALNGNGTGLTHTTTPLPASTPIGGRILRNGCNQIANGATAVKSAAGDTIPIRCFPENYLVMNPQFDAPLPPFSFTGGGANYYNNTGFSNYHSLQTQLILRPTNGTTLTGTYTWSKTMALTPSDYTDFRNRDLDYTLSGQHIKHDFR